mmetsp:Transcript_75582/g.133810  ORF Transcript_75582/g.133810 Transcript_75582/m.133810 type:complete len:127 (+) Transcript_75582:1112-1492(+)
MSAAVRILSTRLTDLGLMPCRNGDGAVAQTSMLLRLSDRGRGGCGTLPLLGSQLATGRAAVDWLATAALTGSLWVPELAEDESTGALKLPTVRLGTDFVADMPAEDVGCISGLADVGGRAQRLPPT